MVCSPAKNPPEWAPSAPAIDGTISTAPVSATTAATPIRARNLPPAKASAIATGCVKAQSWGCRLVSATIAPVRNALAHVGVRPTSSAERNAHGIAAAATR